MRVREVNTSVEIHRELKDCAKSNIAYIEALSSAYPGKVPKDVIAANENEKQRMEEAEKGRVCESRLTRAQTVQLIADIREEAKEVRIARDKPIGKAIIAAVAEWFDLTPEVVTGRARHNYLVSARFVAIRLLRDVTWESGSPRFSLPQIGKMLGGRDHSTIIHALATFDDRARKYGVMNEAYEALRDA